MSGLLGIGSGALKVMAMDYIMHIPLKVSSATSNFMIGVDGGSRGAGVSCARRRFDRARRPGRVGTSGATGNITRCPTSARLISPSSAIRPAARCAACAGAHACYDRSGSRPNCHYDVQDSIIILTVSGRGQSFDEAQL